jgi:hypothetical protein
LEGDASPWVPVREDRMIELRADARLQLALAQRDGWRLAHGRDDLDADRAQLHAARRLWRRGDRSSDRDHALYTRSRVAQWRQIGAGLRYRLRLAPTIAHNQEGDRAKPAYTAQPAHDARTLADVRRQS